MKSLIIFNLTLSMFLVSCTFQTGKIGLHDDFSSAEGWWEISSQGDSVAPVMKLESVDGALVIPHKYRTLEFAAEKWPWIESTVDTSSNLNKYYDSIDLDKYHYVVLNVKEKGTSSYFYINGFRTKLGYTTGITVIDLKDYEDERISGTKKVRFSIDLQDNHTHLTLEDLKFVSELSKKERERLLGAGLTIRDENFDPLPYHGLEALKYRETIPLAEVDGEEMVIFRDDATGAITTRLTATAGDDFFGEGGIWSGDGAAIKFESSRKTSGIPICIPGEGKVIAGPNGAAWRMWSEKDPDILYLMKRDSRLFSVFAWNKVSGEEELIAEFTTPEYTRSYVEFKQFTPSGNIVVGFRETPYLYIIDINKKTARFVELPTRLKDVGIGGEDNIASWANCYTYERWWMNLDTGEKRLAPSFSSGHASHGANGMVANFGGHLNVFVPGDIGMTFTPGDKIEPWANWKNNIVTDYGSVSIDNKFVFTNGRRDDVNYQHLMIPSDDPGAVMRVARYFTRFSWTSTTYSRPSPDYTKLVYNENMIGSTELQMVYTRRPDAPGNVTLKGEMLTWNAPHRKLELRGYNLYGSNNSGRNFLKVNENPLTDNSVKVDGSWKYYAVTSVEHSGLESLFSNEASSEGAKSFYFEAEEMKMTPPARRFFDGYASSFQTARINAQSPEEDSISGKISILLNHVPAGNYYVWGRVKGKGDWSLMDKSFHSESNEWEWVNMGEFSVNGSGEQMDITSADDNLKLDMVLFTSENFVPDALYPADAVAPQKVQNVKASVKGNNVQLSWDHSGDADLHHYSIYCGDSNDFECNNETVIRSVLKNSVTDVLPEKPKGLFYKIVAVDNRWNESEPSIIRVN